MTKDQIIYELKVSVGITTNAQDKRLELIVDGIIDEAKEQHGITLDIENRADHALFVLDYAKHRYKTNTNSIPDDIRWRLIHFYIHDGGNDDV